MNILLIIMFMIMPLVMSAQLQSPSYFSPARGIVSSGGAIQSQNYSASGTVVWYDLTVNVSTNYSQTGIGNIEIINGKGTTDVEENNYKVVQNYVFPNPISEESVLRFSAQGMSTVTLEICDYLGVKVYDEEVITTSSGIAIISLRKFYQQAGAGVFILKLRNETESKTIIILKI